MEYYSCNMCSVDPELTQHPPSVLLGLYLQWPREAKYLVATVASMEVMLVGVASGQRLGALRLVTNLRAPGK